MVKNIYEVNQHWRGNYPMKWYPYKLIYIKTLTIISQILFFLKHDIQLQIPY